MQLSLLYKYLFIVNINYIQINTVFNICFIETADTHEI